MTRSITCQTNDLVTNLFHSIIYSMITHTNLHSASVGGCSKVECIYLTLQVEPENGD